MAKRIITISREFGSGGRFIGEETAKKLGIGYYDKDIIGQIAIQSGLSQEYIRESLNCSRIFRFTYGQISCIIEPHESGENPASVFPQR